MKNNGFSDKDDLEKIKDEVRALITENDPWIIPIPRLEIKSSSYLDEWRAKYEWWLNVVRNLKDEFSFRIRNESRQTGFCFIIRCDLENEGYIFALNPLLNLYISVVQVPSGLKLDTSHHLGLEGRILYHCSEYFDNLRPLSKDLYSARLAEYSDYAIVDLIFIRSLLLLNNKYLDEGPGIIPRFINSENKDKLILKIRQFIVKYYRIHYDYQIYFSRKFLSEDAINFKPIWSKFLAKLADQGQSYRDMTLNPVSGFMLSMLLDPEHHYFVSVSAHLPYWSGMVYNTVNYSPVKFLNNETYLEFHQHVVTVIYTSFPNHRWISIEQARIHLEETSHTSLGEVLFGEIWKIVVSPMIK